MDAVDVLITGAGPTGLLLANLLARSGLSVLLIDKTSEPARESRALGIQARTLELLQSLDLADRFLEAGMKAAGATLSLRGRARLKLNLSDMARPDTPFPFVFLLSQAKSEALLIEDLAKHNVQVTRQTELEDFTQDEKGVSAKIKTVGALEGEKVREMRARFLVGCDGSHSFVREKLGLEFKGDAYPTEFIMADAKVEWPLPNDRLQIFLDPGAVGVFFPQKEGVSRVLAIRRFSNDEKRPITDATTSWPATLEEVEASFNHASHQNAKLSDPKWVTRFHVHHRSVQRMRVGHVFLAGDAAHIHSPLGAQGMNTGLQDAANLAWKLAAVVRGTIVGEEADALLESYQTERWPVGQHLLRFTDRFFTAVISTNKWMLTARDSLIPIVTKTLMTFPAGKRIFFRFISQLNIRYHQSIAAKEALSPGASKSFRESLPAGRRAPDAQLNSDLHLFDLLRGYRFHALIMSRHPITDRKIEETRQAWRSSRTAPSYDFEQIWIGPGDSTAKETVRVDHPEVFDRYGITDEGVFLVRPDNYIGFRSDRIKEAFSLAPTAEPHPRFSALHLIRDRLSKAARAAEPLVLRDQ